MKHEEKVWIIIQARLGSTRLKNKMLLHFKGQSILSWSIQRLMKCKNVEGVAIAIPNNELDAKVLAQCIPQEVRIFQGSSEDLCERYYHAAKELACTQVVRVCADNPLICPELVDELIEFHLKNSVDYSWNHIPLNNQFPDGLGAEITSFQTLEWIFSNAKGAQREHLFNVLRENKTLFHFGTYNPKDSKLCRPELKFDIDTWDDYIYLNKFNFNVTMNAREIIHEVDSYVNAGKK
tara:strand:+ start:3071 stop:3778 length:708 start_codon:yes stop_codon:yes gene_type:complete